MEADLMRVQTSPGCISIRLIAGGQIIWSNRTFARNVDSELGAISRLEDFAHEHGITVYDEAGRLLFTAEPATTKA